MMEDGRPVIGHVLHRLYLAGAEVLAGALARKLGDRYRFVFLCLDEIGPLGAELQAEGFTVLDLQRQPGVDWGLGRRMRAAIAAQGIDVLHAHQYTPFFYAALGRGWRGQPGILFTEHGRHYPDERKWKRVLANRLLLRRGDRVTAVGEWVKAALVANEGIAAGRIEVVYNGIDAEKFQRREDWLSVRRQLREELGIAREAVVAAQVARFHPVKDHATAVRAWAEVIGRRKAQGMGEPAVLLLAGDGEKKAEMEKLATELRIRESVRFAGVRKDVDRLLAAADVFVLSSLSEGISVTLLEAMAAELPIAATKVGGNGEVVAEGVTGLLSPRGDAAALGANLAQLLADQDLREQMGRRGRERLLTLFTQERMHARFAAIYEEMTRDRAQGKRI